MAFVDDQQDPQNPETGTPDQAQPQTSSGSSANASVASSPSTNPQGTTAVPNATQAPPVQNLQAYLQANAPQALGMGQNIAKQLEGGYQAVNKDIGNAQQQFEGEVSKSAAPSNAQDIVSQAAQNPTQFVKDPNNVSQFQKVQNANYTGPSNFEGSNYYSNLNSEIQHAQQQAPDISNPANIQQLVRGQERNPTAGQSNLDTLLLQQSPGGVAAIKSATAPYATLGDTLKGLASSQNQKISDTKAGVDKAKASVPNAFLTGQNAVVPTWENALNQKVQTAAGDYANQGTKINALTQAINAGDLSKLSPDQLAGLGISADQAAYLMNAKGQLGNFSSAPAPATSYTPGTLNPQAPNSATVASSEDYAMQQALESLLGTGFTNAPLNDEQSNLAGTYNPVGTKGTFDPSGYSSNIANTFLKTLQTGGWATGINGLGLPEALQRLELQQAFSKGQQPGQFNYMDPKIASMINALKDLQGTGYLPANPH